jgi:hypothetical protein
MGQSVSDFARQQHWRLTEAGVFDSEQRISATSSTGWVFIGWGDGDTNASRTVAVPANGGTVSGSGTFTVGSRQQIFAVPDDGWAFIGWSDGETQNPRTVTIPVDGPTYRATFMQRPSLAVSLSGGTSTLNISITGMAAVTYLVQASN